jgi:aspartate aminotransferase-like enzyme
MSTRAPLVFKFASEDWEFEAIHRLNYRTFVEEIPQHKVVPTQRLVDKFHSENTYLICLSGRNLAGMLAARGNRPFSLDQKLEAVDSYLPAGRRLCEIRLLAVDKKFRGAQVLQGILALLWQHGIEKGYDLAVISGTTRQFKLYKHLGFVPFGPVVGSGEAEFQPMYVTLETFENSAREFLRSSPSRSFQASAVNYLPGPVTVRRDVKRAFEQAPESHRSEAFIQDFNQVRKTLCSLTKANSVELMMGSGTLANDVVAAQIALLGGKGLILSNGEFGERLIDHARRAGLAFDAMEVQWGSALDMRSVRAMLEQNPQRSWVWCSHCETSSGVLNDIRQLEDLCAEFQVKLCLDCVSSVGTMPVDLSGVYLASASSGKGLRAYPGVAIVFYNHDLAATPASKPVPRYLDLAYYASNQGIPFTLSSNLLQALHAAIKRGDWEKRFADLAETGPWLRQKLRELGFALVGENAKTSPAVVTIQLPAAFNSTQIGKLMQESGYLISCNSEYLRKRNWVQVCLMGESGRDRLPSLLNAFHRACFKRKQGKAEEEANPETSPARPGP